MAVLVAGRDLRCCWSSSLVACSAREFRLTPLPLISLISLIRALPLSRRISHSVSQPRGSHRHCTRRSRHRADSCRCILSFFFFPAPLPPPALFGRRPPSTSARRAVRPPLSRPPLLTQPLHCRRSISQSDSQPAARHRIADCQCALLLHHIDWRRLKRSRIASRSAAARPPPPATAQPSSGQLLVQPLSGERSATLAAVTLLSQLHQSEALRCRGCPSDASSLWPAAAPPATRPLVHLRPSPALDAAALQPPWPASPCPPPPAAQQ